jgi:class 3 adenylate cyclase
MIDSLEAVLEFAQSKFKIAWTASTQISFSENKAFHYSKDGGIQASMVTEIPRFRELDVGYGVDAWAAILFVDLRSSSWRAEVHGAKATYLAMHTYLPTMSYLVGRADGYIVGYRGDGLIAAFGLDSLGKNPPDLDYGREVQNAIRCAKGMIEAMDDAVNPVLREGGVPAGMEIGVGIDAAKVVITNIGLREAFEVTAYGTAVNKAAKLSDCGNAEVIVAHRAKRLLPPSTGHHRWFARSYKTSDGMRVTYPADYIVLNRSAQKSRSRAFTDNCAANETAHI